MEQLILKFKKASAWQKAFYIILLPLVLVYLGPSLLAGIKDWILSLSKQDSQDRLKKLEKDLVENQSKEKLEQEKIKELEEQKKREIENVGKKDPADFINDRFDPTKQ